MSVVESWAEIVETLDRYQRAQPENLPGASFGIDDGEDARVASVGSWRTDSIACVGSLSKPVVAAAALLVLDTESDGDLDRPAWTLPGMQSLGHDGARRAITVRHLLQQTSGLASMLRLEDLAPSAGDDDLPADPDRSVGPVVPWVGSPGLTNEFVRAGGMRRPARRATLSEVADHVMRRYPLVSEPGSRFAYATTNYVLLAHLIEQLTGKAVNRVVRERLLLPLGMIDTFFVPGSSGDADLDAHIADPVEPAQRARIADFAYLTPHGGLPVEAAAGPDLRTLDRYRSGWRFVMADLGMYSTVQDLLQFLRMLRSDGMHAGVRILPRRTVSLLIDDQGHGHTLGFGFRRRTGADGETFSVLEHMGIGMTYFWLERRDPPTAGAFLSQRICNMAVDNNMADGMRAIFRVFLPAVARAVERARERRASRAGSFPGEGATRMDDRAKEIVWILEHAEQRLRDVRKRYGSDAEEIMKCEDARRHLEELATEGDAYLVEDYTLVDPFGTVCDKAHVHERIASGANLFEVYERTDHQVRFYGSTAIYVSLVSIKGRRFNMDINARFRETHTLIQTDAGWKMVACQMTFVDAAHQREHDDEHRSQAG